MLGCDIAQEETGQNPVTRMTDSESDFVLNVELSQTADTSKEEPARN